MKKNHTFKDLEVRRCVNDTLMYFALI